MLQVLVVISQSFVVEKRNGAMQKLLKKEKQREKNDEKKIDTKVSEILKTMGSQRLAEKKKNKIAHIL